MSEEKEPKPIVVVDSLPKVWTPPANQVKVVTVKAPGTAGSFTAGLDEALGKMVASFIEYEEKKILSLAETKAGASKAPVYTWQPLSTAAFHVSQPKCWARSPEGLTCELGMHGSNEEHEALRPDAGCCRDVVRWVTPTRKIANITYSGRRKRPWPERHAIWAYSAKYNDSHHARQAMYMAATAKTGVSVYYYQSIGFAVNRRALALMRRTIVDRVEAG